MGKPAQKTHIIIDKSRAGEDSPDGEICVYGPQIMMGDHHKPALNKEVMMPHKWNGFAGIRTGDRGWFDEDGFLRITGRFKDEYKLENGTYVHPGIIENEIKLLPHVASAMIYDEGKPFHVAVIVPDFAALKADPDTKGSARGTLEETLQSEELKNRLLNKIMDHVPKSFGG